MIRELMMSSCIIISMFAIIGLEIYILTNLTHIQNCIKNNETSPSPQKFISYCKECYAWCLTNCVRHISRRYGTINDYNNCIHTCQQAYGVHYHPPSQKN